MNVEARKRPVPFAYGFCPFLLLAGIYAVVAMATWLWMFARGVMPSDIIAPQFWHGHEMIFGFSIAPLGYQTTIFVAGVLWLVSFGIYVPVYTPILLGPRTDGRPG